MQLALSPECQEERVERASSAKERRGEKPLVVILDQVEETFTCPNQQQPNELDDSLKVLGAIFLNTRHRPKGKLILRFRKEWLAELEKD